MSKPVPVTTTQHVRQRCLCFAAQRAARRLARRFDEAFRPLDLTNGQFSLLMSLNRSTPASIGEIAEFLAMDRTTLTAALKPLDRRGLLRIAVDRADRRSRRLMLTEAGHTLLRTALPIWKRTHAEADKLLGAVNPGDLRAGLDALI